MDLEAAVPDYDLPFRAEAYDLVFAYDVRPGDVAATLAHRGRGALHVETSPASLFAVSNSSNATNTTTNATYEMTRTRWYREARVAVDAGAFGSIKRASNGDLVTKADTTVRGPMDLEAILGFGGSTHVSRRVGKG